jgi:glycosyltransferase involved in cell wall biosynthesis
MLFVGVHCEDKGLGDAIDALARLAADGHDLRLTCIGPGDSEPFRRRAEARGVGHAVQFLGRLEHPRVLEQMRQHDAVLVPSRHVYAEGLPMTLYDAYSSRTPLLASDHPMFRDKVEHGFSGLCFRAGDPANLARRVRELCEEPGLYRRLSANAEEAFRRIECPAKWAELVYRWLRDAPEDRRWLGRHALAPAQEVSHSDRTRHKAA